MANPVVTPILTKDTWTKITTNVTGGRIHRLNTNPVYMQTYRSTGGAAPTLKTEGALAFKNSNTEIINHSEGIDVYIYPVRYPGLVRVDL